MPSATTTAFLPRPRIQYFLTLRQTRAVVPKERKKTALKQKKQRLVQLNLN